jgi:hypothetical protein
VRWLVALFVVLVLTIGCAPAYPDKDGQRFATQVVWQQQYLQSADTAPAVIWMQGSMLNCHQGLGWTINTSVPLDGVPDGCVAGLFYEDLNLAYVAWPDGTEYIYQTSFAHELCHAYMWKAYGYGDGTHMGPCFTGPTYVTTANEALMWEDL